MRILLIEDEKKLSDLITKGLSEESYIVEQAFDGEQGETMILENEYDLIILDLMLPKIDGMTLCKTIRESDIDTPILMLSAKSMTKDKIQGLTLGADDYLTKPFDFDELLARIWALLRRHSKFKREVLQAADLTLDPQSNEVERAGQEIQLTRQEFRLLEYLLLNKGIAISRFTLAERVWADAEISPATIEVYINYLRKKVDKPFDTQLIQTVRGLGYTIKD